MLNFENHLIYVIFFTLIENMAPQIVHFVDSFFRQIAVFIWRFKKDGLDAL